MRALGTSFFCVLSILIAFYAFTEMPQVQDLLLDARPYWVQEAVYWSSFYVIGIFVWALPLVFTARLLLLQNFDLIGVDTEDRFKFYIFAFPRFYAIFAFIAVLLGMLAASQNIPSPSNGTLYELSLHKFVEFHLIVLCFATASVTVVIFIRDVFISYYRRRMEAFAHRNPDLCKKSLMRIESLTRKPCPDQKADDPYLTALKPEYISTETWIVAQRAKLFMWGYMSVLTWVLLVFVVFHFLSYSATLRWIFPSIYFQAHPAFQAAWNVIADAVIIKRAPLLLVLLGGWLPFLTILAILSNRHQFPFITAFIVVGILLTPLTGDGHDMRIMALSKEQQARLKPVSFSEALRDWKAASGWNGKGCEQLPAATPALADCPRPVIVAGEGGGSRAAFLFASVLGVLEDDSLDKRRNPDGRPFHNQLFAISSVSGSSVGAAFFVSALNIQPGASPGKLENALYRQRLWFRNAAASKLDGIGTGSRFLNGLVTYKDALQAALSNDFVSPTMIGLFARDVSLASVFPPIMDRAGVLETAWEDAFNDVYGTSGQTSPLSGPLQAIVPRPDRWTPLVFMNATSMETGRRIIVTPVETGSGGGTAGKALFTDTYSLHELLCAPYPGPVADSYPRSSALQNIASAFPSLFRPVVKCAGTEPVSAGIRLSTAASVSSRSPFVTPHAGIRNRTGQLIDSAVDGGYFDNSGIVTALDIARSVKALDARLLPFILQVSNNPEWFEASRNCGAEGIHSAGPHIPNEVASQPLGALTDPLTVNSTRMSRGYETILELPQRASQLNGGIVSVAQIHVCPQPEESFWDFLRYYSSKSGKEGDKERRMPTQQEVTFFKSISLSWWLSSPLQAYLDGQIYSEHNQTERNCIISLLSDSNIASACGGSAGD